MLSILILIILVVSILVTYFVLQIAPRVGLVCVPSHRNLHTRTMPHGGGLGFVLPFFLTLSILLYQGYLPESQWLVLVGCGGLIAVVGLWDDIIHIAVRWRLLVQFLCVSIGVWLLGGFFVIQTGNQVIDMGLVGFGLSVIMLMWWLNLFNFMDGIDGLAASEAIFIAIGAIMVLWFGDWISVSAPSSDTATIELLLVILATSVLGFLVFNWPPARIFMGDVGSTFLGFVLGMIALMSVVEGFFSFWFWLVLGGVFWVDATFTLLRRMLSGERWYQAHRSHAYQHATLLLDSNDALSTSNVIRRLHSMLGGHSHNTVCVMVIIINVFWLLPMAGLTMLLPEFDIFLFLIAWCPLVFIAYRLEAGVAKLGDLVDTEIGVAAYSGEAEH